MSLQESRRMEVSSVGDLTVLSAQIDNHVTVVSNTLFLAGDKHKKI